MSERRPNHHELHEAALEDATRLVQKAQIIFERFLQSNVPDSTEEQFMYSRDFPDISGTPAVAIGTTVHPQLARESHERPVSCQIRELWHPPAPEHSVDFTAYFIRRNNRWEPNLEGERRQWVALSTPSQPGSTYRNFLMQPSAAQSAEELETTWEFVEQSPFVMPSETDIRVIDNFLERALQLVPDD